MRAKMIDGHEVATDGRTVWVNSGIDGSNIARFSRVGIDVHHTAMGQKETGTECLFCTHEPTDLEDWKTFQTEVHKHYGVHVPDEFKPTWLK
jgi:hypothetical protein